MASRADAIAPGVPDGTGARDDAGPPARPVGVGSLRATLSDAYFHSWRLAAVNVSWSMAAFAITVAAVATPLALALLPLLAVPTAAIFRITTRIARGHAVSFWDGYRGIRADLRPVLGVGVAVTLAGLVFAVNVLTGLASGSPIGWGIATLAAWGIVATFVLSWTVWPVLLDPDRQEDPAIARIRLGAMLALAHPIRLAGLAAGIALLLIASTVLVAPLLTISVALAALWSSEVVLPAADRLEALLAGR